MKLLGALCFIKREFAVVRFKLLAGPTGESVHKCLGSLWKICTKMLGQENHQACKDWVISFISIVYQWIPYNTWWLWYIFIEEKHNKNKRSKSLWHSGMQPPIEIYLEHENMCLLARWGCIFLSNGINFGVGRYKIVHFRAFNNICSDPQETEEECFIS